MGWTPAFFSEIEPFPSAVLNHHYPNVPNYGDLTKYNEWPVAPGSIDLLVGGTPCQSFSVAGLRKGLEDPRGNLCLTFLGLVDKLKPQWVLWENVPGVLSSGGGRDFGSFLGALGQIGYGWSYRVLDAQYFGVAQRRRRVFVVGYLGDWRRAAQVLFESESVCGHPPPSRKTGQSIAPCVTQGPPFSRTGNEPVECEAIIPFRATGRASYYEDTKAEALRAAMHKQTDVDLIVNPIASGSHWDGTEVHPSRSPQSSEVTRQVAAVHEVSMAVRRLTPTECERLQGFPDGHTLIPWKKKPSSECPDGPRYKALGNSMAVPVMRWIGERINRV